jgi:hypothetical protein
MVQPAASAGAAFCANRSSGAFPRDDRADHPHRLPQGEDQVVAALVRRERLAGQLVHPARVVVEDVGHTGR